jgi:argininosuccinate lyase
VCDIGPFTHDHLETTLMTHDGTFPHPVYARHVLEPQFHEAQRLLFSHMIAASQAHTLMLVETGIMAPDQAGALLQALATVAAEGATSFAYAPQVEDLFFAVEARLVALAGLDAGGNFQIARSRNDLDAAMCRMLVRDRLLAILDAATALRSVLLDLATAHLRTLMPGITHTQPAQPTTLAHQLLGVLGPLERDTTRLLAAYDTVNRSPLGVAAFTTTSFPIDRTLAARLLGFDGLVENGYDAVGASDHMVEATQAVANMAGSLSRFVHDLLVWARMEVGVLQIDDAFIQISSIMPQKRNPVVLEHIGVRIGWVYGDASTVATIVHSAAFGDTNDVNDPIYRPLDRTFTSGLAVLELLASALETATFDVDLLARRAYEGNATTTGLAEALVLNHGLPWRSAHHVLSASVSRALAGNVPITAALVNEASTGVLDAPLELTDDEVATALDPWAFVEARTLPGGPAPATVTRAMSEASARLAADRNEVVGRKRAIDAAKEERDARILTLNRR